jgi:broad specificity phosphatase PhoE
VAASFSSAAGGPESEADAGKTSAGRPKRSSILTPKSILCIRHGESTFNAAWRATGVDPLQFDAPLSEVGAAQVRLARARLTSSPVELVISSPLTRALQTAAGLFEDHPHAPRILVSSLARERVESSCDIGRSPVALAVDFPRLELDHLEEVWWHTEGIADDRGVCIEPVAIVETRVQLFKSFLLARPERCIAVVGHGTFFFHLTGKVLANCEAFELELAP